MKTKQIEPKLPVTVHSLGGPPGSTLAGGWARAVFRWALAVVAFGGLAAAQAQSTNLPPTIRGISPESASEGDTVQLTATIFAPDSTPPLKFLWRLPDGSFSTNEAPIVTLDDLGIYSVELMVEDNHGSVSVPFRMDLPVSNVPPRIHAISPPSGGEGQRLDFGASVTDAGRTDRHRYEWTLPDGTTSASLTPSFAFGPPGDYPISLVVRELGLEYAYNNSRESGDRARFYAKNAEAGDELRLGGTNRRMTEFQFIYYGSFTNLTPDQASQVTGRVRIYAADGPTITSKNIPTPGTVLFDSGPFPLAAGYHWQSFRGLAVTLPGVVIWTFEPANLDQTPGQQAGMVFYHSTQRTDADVGTSYDDFWRRRGDGTWGLFRFGGLPISDFGCRVICAGQDPIAETPPFVQTVSITNTPPVIVAVSAPDNGIVSAALAFTASATDAGGGLLAYHWSFGDGAAGDGPQVTHAYTDPGTYQVELVVRDSLGATDARSFPVRIGADPSALRFSSTPVTSVNERDFYRYEITTITPGAGQTLTLAAPTLPSWLSFSDRGYGTGLLTGQPGQVDVGSHVVTLRLGDGTVTVGQSFTLVVMNVNDPPTLSSIPDFSIRVNRALGPVVITAADPDTAPAALIFKATSSDQTLLPDSNLRLEGQGDSRQLWATPAADRSGACTITVTVSDAQFPISTSFRLTVLPIVMRTLTLQTSGNGQVLADPLAAQYQDDSQVTLVAHPGAGFAFTGWSGDAGGDANPLTLTLDANKTVRANFKDQAAPVITILTPANAPTPNQVIDFSGTVQDNAGVATAEWARDGFAQGPLPLDNGNFSIRGLRLDRGDHKLRVVATDINGNASTGEVTVTWSPNVMVKLIDPSDQREGRLITVPVVLTSRGEVQGMTFTLTYDAPYLGEPEFNWSSLLSSSFNVVNTNTPGEVRITFSAIDPIPAGAQLLGTFQARVRSVPFTLTSLVDISITEASGTDPNLTAEGIDTFLAEARLLKRAIIGDLNSNSRLDVNDAHLLQQMIAGLIPVRTWDLGLNDLNHNNQLDSGDVVQILQVVAGRLPQPQPALQGGRLEQPVWVGGELETVARGVGLQGAPPSGPRAILEAPQGNVAAGQQITMRVRLEGVTEPLTGVSFRLRYPADALQLSSLTSYAPGPIVPANAVKVWNSIPPPEASISFAAVSVDPWPQPNGIVAEFSFIVLGTVPDDAMFNLLVDGLDVGFTGYDLGQLAGAQTGLQTGVQFPPSRFTGFLRDAAGLLDFKVQAASGQLLLLETSADLLKWAPFATLPSALGRIQVADPVGTASPQRFYRIKAFPPASSVVEAAPGTGRDLPTVP